MGEGWGSSRPAALVWGDGVLNGSRVRGLLQLTLLAMGGKLAEALPAQEHSMLIRILVGRMLVISTPLSLYYLQPGLRTLILIWLLYFVLVEIAKWLCRRYKSAYLPHNYRFLNNVVLWFWDGFRSPDGFER